MHAKLRKFILLFKKIYPRSILNFFSTDFLKGFFSCIVLLYMSVDYYERTVCFAFMFLILSSVIASKAVLYDCGLSCVT